MNSFSTSITPGERVSLEGEVSGSLVVTIVEGIAGAAVSRAEETCNNRGGVFIELRVLVTREVGLVIIGSRLITSVGDLELITSSKPDVAGTEDVAGKKSARWWTQFEVQSALWFARWKIHMLSHQSPSNHQ